MENQRTAARLAGSDAEAAAVHRSGVLADSELDIDPGAHPASHIGDSSALAPISRLPSELLAEILVIAHESSNAAASAKHMPVEITAVQVSRLWHATAIGTGALWSTIYIHTNGARTAAYLERSRNHALDAQIICESAEILGRCRPAYTALFLQIERLRTLSIHARVGNDLRLLLDMLPAAAPSLTSLDVRLQELDWSGGTFRLFSAGAPLLTTFSLSGIDVERCKLPLSQVSSFSSTTSWITLPFLLTHLYRIMPALTRLETYGGLAEIARRTHPRAASIKALGVIGVEHLVAFTTADPLAQLALHDFILTFLLEPELPSTLAPARLAGIRVFELHNFALTTPVSECPGLFRALQALETLRLVQHRPFQDSLNILLGALAGWDATTAVPRMRWLVVDSDFVEAAVLSDVVRMRANGRVPLEKLTLRASLCDNIPPATLAELRLETTIEMAD